jgi:hypothetical protein
LKAAALHISAAAESVAPVQPVDLARRSRTLEAAGKARQRDP